MLVYTVPPSNSCVFLSDMPLIIVVCFLLSHIHACSHNMCVAYVDVELFVLIYLICSLYLTFIAPPDCPTYIPLHVLHFNLYIPNGSLYDCFLVSCCIVCIAWKVTCRSGCLNKLVTRLISGLKCVNITHFFMSDNFFLLLLFLLLF